jgi:hypothetical protein
MLLAEVTYWWLYSEPAGLWVPEAEAQLAGKPANVIEADGVCEEAVVALLKGVRDVGMPAAAAMLPPSAPAEWSGLTDHKSKVPLGIQVERPDEETNHKCDPQGSRSAPISVQTATPGHRTFQNPAGAQYIARLHSARITGKHKSNHNVRLSNALHARVDCRTPSTTSRWHRAVRSMPQRSPSSIVSSRHWVLAVLKRSGVNHT